MPLRGFRARMIAKNSGNDRRDPLTTPAWHQSRLRRQSSHPARHRRQNCGTPRANMRRRQSSGNALPAKRSPSAHLCCQVCLGGPRLERKRMRRPFWSLFFWPESLRPRPLRQFSQAPVLLPQFFWWPVFCLPPSLYSPFCRRASWLLSRLLYSPFCRRVFGLPNRLLCSLFCRQVSWLPNRLRSFCWKVRAMRPWPILSRILALLQYHAGANHIPARGGNCISAEQGCPIHGTGSARISPALPRLPPP